MDDLTRSGSTVYYTVSDQTLKSAVHDDGDNAFTQAIKNLSNNLVIQYNQPSANERVPKFDGDYTKWNAFLASVHSPRRQKPQSIQDLEAQQTQPGCRG